MLSSAASKPDASPPTAPPHGRNRTGNPPRSGHRNPLRHVRSVMKNRIFAATILVAATAVASGPAYSTGVYHPPAPPPKVHKSPPGSSSTGKLVRRLHHGLGTWRHRLSIAGEPDRKSRTDAGRGMDRVELLRPWLVRPCHPSRAGPTRRRPVLSPTTLGEDLYEKARRSRRAFSSPVRPAFPAALHLG